MGYTPALAAAPTPATPAVPSDLSENEITKMVDEHLSVQALIRGYQIRGHLYSNLDPLYITKPALQGTESDLLTADSKEVKDNLMGRPYPFSEADLDKVYQLPKTTFIGGEEKSLPLREIVARLENVYCNHIGVEYMHINNLDQINWIRELLETPGALEL